MLRPKLVLPLDPSYDSRLSIRLIHRILAFNLLLLLVFNTWGASLHAQNMQQPWHILADELNYDQAAKTYMAKGNVLITKETTRLSADSVRFDHQTMTAYATGNVVLTDGDDIMSGSRVEIDMEKSVGTIYDADLFFQKRHFYIRADRIDKIGEKTYTAEKATFTTCDGDRPAWKITGRNLKVTVDGYATVKHAAIWGKRIPVLYSPYMVVPVKQDRQSGLLIPQAGYSNRNGFAYNQPFFWAINDSSDTTLFLEYLEQRGLRAGVEGRYTLTNTSKGTIKFDYLEDDKIDDGTPENAEWGFNQDDLDRTNTDRYWLRGKVNQDLGYDFKAKLDLDYVSDQDYLFEFKRGYMGFDRSDDYFAVNYGRDLNDYDETVRNNSLNIRRNWDAYLLDMSAIWNDNVVARRFDEPDTTIQGLPVLGFTGSKQQLMSSPLYFDLDSEYVYFHRQDGTPEDNITGMHRADVYPRLYLPMGLKNYLTLEPSAGLRGTYWNTSDVADSTLDETGSDSRAIYDADVRLFSTFYNIFKTNGKYMKRLKHLVRPDVVYTYIPDQDQDDLPYFSDLDRIGKRNVVTYSLTNTLISKSIDGLRVSEEPLSAVDSDNNDDYLYRQLLRFYLEQSYDFNEEDDNTEDPEPLTPIFGELEFSPWDRLYFKADANWSTYENQVITQNYELRLSDLRGDYVDLRYRNRIDEEESVSLLARFRINRQVTGFLEYQQDILNDERVRMGYGLRYSSQCWAFDISYIDEFEDAQNIYFRIHLKGLGDFGQSFNSTGFGFGS